MIQGNAKVSVKREADRGGDFHLRDGIRGTLRCNSLEVEVPRAIHENQERKSAKKMSKKTLATERRKRAKE